MALDDDIRLFSQIPIFRLMEMDALRLLAFSAETKLLRAGDLLTRAPAVPDAGYLVVKGSLAVFDNADQIGTPRQIVQGPGLVGELAMIAEIEPFGSIVAREPTTLLRISRAMFHRVLSEYPASAEAIRTKFKEKIAAISAELAPLASH